MPPDRELCLTLKASGRWQLDCTGAAVFRRQGDHIELAFLLARWNSANAAVEWLLRRTEFRWGINFDLAPPPIAPGPLPTFVRQGRFLLTEGLHLLGTARTVRRCCRMAGIDPGSIEDAGKRLYRVEALYATRRPQAGTASG
jgi:hypothetical protein